MTDMSAWSALRSSMQRSDARNARRVDWHTLRRVGRFARHRRSTILAFLALATMSAALGVASPVLAGRAVNAIVDGEPVRTVVTLAAVIAAIAVLDAVVGVFERLKSSRLGEGIIFDLRRAVFDHMQTMPVAFFHRTHTGALVSRLNNDVIGAQRAFTSALAGVVTNSIALALTLVVMFNLSWQVTVASMVLLPVFVIPARRVGAKVGRLERDAAVLNAAMTSQMTERFSAPGATLVKLFGDPEFERDEFAGRAGEVRDIGVRSAMATEVFMSALGLVSGLAQAVIYGLGGYLALNGTLDAGAVVTLALLLNRLYAPLTALANARLDVATALVSFERVFEVLDIEPLITDADDAVDLPSRQPVAVELDAVEFAYPSADRISLASLEEVAVLDERINEAVLHDITLRIEPGQTVALVGASGSGKSTIAALVSRLYDVDAGAVRIGGVDVRELSSGSIRETVGVVTQDGHLFHDTIANNLRYARPDATDEELWEALERAEVALLIASLARRPRHHRRRARLPLLGWRATAAHDRSNAAARSSRRRPRRGDIEPRLPFRGRRAGRARHGARRTDRVGDRPPTVDRPRRRLDRGARPRPHRRAGNPRRTPRTRRPVRRALPHPVRLGRDRAGRHRRLGRGSTPRAPNAQREARRQTGLTDPAPADSAV